MRRNFRNFFLTLLVLPIVAFFISGGCAVTELHKISVDTLSTQLDNPDLVIIDVRQDRDWKASAQKIKGAVRESPYSATSWAGKYAKDSRIVLYCA